MDIYDKLGVSKLINLRGASTKYGGSIISNAARKGFFEGSKYHVDISELLSKASSYITTLINCEAVCISNGAAGGMKICVAAILAKNNKRAINSLPDVKVLKKEIIIQKCNSKSYINQGMKSAGAELIEVGNERLLTIDDINANITKYTVAIQLFSGKENQPSISEVKNLIGKRKIIIMVDAASEIPPLSNLSDGIEAGADLFVVSGGKGIRGPQNTGLIVGRKKLVDYCQMNSSPYTSIGRTMKISKEDICSLVYAIEKLKQINEEKMFKRIKTFAVYTYNYLIKLNVFDVYIKSPSEKTRKDILRVHFNFKKSSHLRSLNLQDLMLKGEKKFLLGDDQRRGYYIDFLFVRKSELKQALNNINLIVNTVTDD